MDANSELAKTDEREEKIQQAIAITRHRNWERYGIDDVDEAWVRRQPDWWLDHIINPVGSV